LWIIGLDWSCHQTYTAIPNMQCHTLYTAWLLLPLPACVQPTSNQEIISLFAPGGILQCMADSWVCLVYGGQPSAVSRTSLAAQKKWMSNVADSKRLSTCKSLTSTSVIVVGRGNVKAGPLTESHSGMYVSDAMARAVSHE